MFLRNTAWNSIRSQCGVLFVLKKKNQGTHSFVVLYRTWQPCVHGILKVYQNEKHPVLEKWLQHVHKFLFILSESSTRVQIIFLVIWKRKRIQTRTWTQLETKQIREFRFSGLSGFLGKFWAECLWFTQTDPWGHHYFTPPPALVRREPVPISMQKDRSFGHVYTFKIVENWEEQRRNLTLMLWTTNLQGWNEVRSFVEIDNFVA